MLHAETLKIKNCAKPLQIERHGCSWQDSMNSNSSSPAPIQRYHCRPVTRYGLVTMPALQTENRQTDNTAYPRFDLTVGQEKQSRLTGKYESQSAEEWIGQEEDTRSTQHVSRHVGWSVFLNQKMLSLSIHRLQRLPLFQRHCRLRARPLQSQNVQR